MPGTRPDLALTVALLASAAALWVWLFLPSHPPHARRPRDWYGAMTAQAGRD